MNDGPEWRVVRSWLVRTLRTLGFGRREMCNLIKEEVAGVLENLGAGGVKHLRPVIAPAVINVLWTLTTGKRLCEGPRYIAKTQLSISLHQLYYILSIVFVFIGEEKKNNKRHDFSSPSTHFSFQFQLVFVVKERTCSSIF